MDKSKKAYYMAVRKLLSILTAAGKNTVEVTLYEDANPKTIDEFRTEIGVNYEYSLIHRGQVRILKTT